MNTQLFIPKKLKVGYQERDDTYTGRLAYVIYVDNKGKVRKEASWLSWTDAKLPREEFDNEPMEGFILNRGVGGARESYGWNTRNEYIRVWDPRGFEFEISVKNLLYILQETSSVKGKGLEGKFVYAWDGKDLVLLPESAQEYKASEEFTKLQDGKVSAKSLIVGATYLTKSQEKLIYMGRFEIHTMEHTRYTAAEAKAKNDEYNKGRYYGSYDRYKEGDRNYTKYASNYNKRHVFAIADFAKYPKSSDYSIFRILSGLTSLASCVDENCIPEYADLMDRLNQQVYMGKPEEFVFTAPLLASDLEVTPGPYGSARMKEHYFYEGNGNDIEEYRISPKIHTKSYAEYKMTPDGKDYERDENGAVIVLKEAEYELTGYDVYRQRQYTLENNILTWRDTSDHYTGKAVKYKDIFQLGLSHAKLKYNDGILKTIKQ